MSTDKKKPKRGPGRPKVPEGKTVQARVRAELYEKFEVAAKAKNKTISEWVRETLRKAVKS